MKADDIKQEILMLTNHVQFKYNGAIAFIDPYSETNFYLGYKDIDKYYTDIDDLMNDPVFDGESLNEIADKIELI